MTDVGNIAAWTDAWLPGVLTAATALISLVASLHAIMIKRDVRGASAWAAICWLVPIFGPIFYLLLGVNRIERRAASLRGARDAGEVERGPAGDTERTLPALPRVAAHLGSLQRLLDRIVDSTLYEGNRVGVLVNGDEAYPAMLEAIENARESVGLSTYIFDSDDVGRAFHAALGDAVARGVEVRVLIDAVGARYSFPSSYKKLVRSAIPCARFLHSTWPWRMPYLNLRNHRKFLLVDGRVCFTGGMNIRAGHISTAKAPAKIRDVHFLFEGPVVAGLMRIFAQDWHFTTDENLEGERWWPALEPCGETLARPIPDGPDKDMDNLHWTLMAAITSARSSVRIATPYFLPDDTLMTALSLAAMRGVEVEILLPSKNNLPTVKWASMHQMPRLVARGCRVALTQPPFDHSKIFVVDGVCSLVGSANWDARSLRLNFEVDVLCYDEVLAACLGDLLDTKKQGAHWLAAADFHDRPALVKLRDAVARLASPYL